ncbi:MAG: PLP-dependent aminotransferase family protein [Lachnospiraceae bacterium]|nr:PLP-dependent aminotransferase family protein [Lachnospiraceae bacterium]
MRYIVHSETGTPAYLQLYQQLRKDITDGYYKTGEKLPSKRILAEETETSVITTEHAYALLEEEGFLEARPRSGYYVIYKEGNVFPGSEVSGTAAGSPLLIPERDDISSDFPGGRAAAGEFFPFSTFARTMRRVLSEYDERILVRSPYNGIPELRNALVSYLGRSRGIHVSPEQILVGSGAEYLYGLLAQLLGQSGIFAIENPSYEIIRRVYESHHVQIEQLSMGKNGIKSDALLDSCAKVLHVTPYHSFPSGVTATATKRREYINWALKRNGFIIEDDYDSEFALSSKTPDTLFSLEPARTVFYLNTFSGTLSPSIRIGYMIMPSELCAQYAEQIRFYSCTVPVFDQLVLAEFIRNGDFERHINRVRRVRRRQDHD